MSVSVGYEFDRVQNDTTWNTDDLVAFVRPAISRNILILHFKVFCLSPRLRKRPDQPTMRVRRRGDTLFVHVPSVPSVLKNVAPLQKLAGAADDKILMPLATRRKLWVLLQYSSSSQWNITDAEHFGHHPASFVEEVPDITAPLNTKHARCKSKARLVEMHEDLKYAAYKLRRKIEHYEERLAKIEAKKGKLLDKIEKLERNSDAG